MTQNEWTFYQRLKPFDDEGRPIRLKQLQDRYYALLAIDRLKQGETMGSIAFSFNYSRNGLRQLIDRMRSFLEEENVYSDVH